MAVSAQRRSNSLNHNSTPTAETSGTEERAQTNHNQPIAVVTLELTRFDLHLQGHDDPPSSGSSAAAATPTAQPRTAAGFSQEEDPLEEGREDPPEEDSDCEDDCSEDEAQPVARDEQVGRSARAGCFPHHIMAGLEHP